MKKQIFVGSSKESLGIAQKFCEAVNRQYNEWLKLELWSESFFDLSGLTILRILDDIPKRDGAVFVLTSPDEKLDPNSNRRPRDNVFLEAGVALKAFGLSKVVIIKSHDVKVGSDLDAFIYLPISDDPDHKEVNEVAKKLYTHFVETPATAVARLGEKSFRELALTRALIKRILTVLKGYRNGYDRIRLYRLNRETESFDGLVELGGVADNFRRVRIPIRTDTLSQVLLHEQACLLHIRDEDENYVTTYIGENKYKERVRLPGNRDLMPHDLPSLDRARLAQWMDIPLIVPHGPDQGKIVGKMTIDNARRDRVQKELTSLDPCDFELWKYAEAAADLIAKSESGELPEWGINGLLNVNNVYKEAFRLAMLDDQLRTLLAEVRGSFPGQFDRLRLYLTTEKHMQLFGNYVMATDPTKRVDAEEMGFWGHVELGGVRTLFADLIITVHLDPCTRICLGTAKPSEKQFQEMLQRGEPVIFSIMRDSTERVCCVLHFYKPALLEREKISEHLDLPIMWRNQIIGKVTMDNKWVSPDQMSVGKDQIEMLESYGTKIGAAIAAAEQMPDDGFCETMVQVFEQDFP